MADKHAKLVTRKSKTNAHDLTLEDVLAVGGDKVGVISLLWLVWCDVLNIISLSICLLMTYDVLNVDLYFTFHFQDDFEMMKDVDVSGDFVSYEDDTSENIKEKEVNEWNVLH